MRVDLLNNLYFQPGRQRIVTGLMFHHEDGDASLSGGATSLVKADPFGLRERYQDNGNIIRTLDEISSALEVYDPAKGQHLDLRGVDFTSLFDIKVGSNEGLNLERYLARLTDKSQYPLVNAHLAKANLTRAYLYQVNLSSANLTRAYLYQVNLTDADLTDANLFSAHLTGANLFRANLAKANLTRAYLYQVNLSSANLTNANFTKAHLINANLTEANLTNANLFEANLTEANLTEANLTEANLTDAGLTDADLRGAYKYLSGKKLEGPSLKEHLTSRFKVVVSDGTRF